MFAAEGAILVVTGRQEDDVAQAVHELASGGTRVRGFAADLSHFDEAHRLAETTLAAVPQLDILINNAGMSIRDPFWEVSDDHWETQVNVNYRSHFILAQHAARHMRQRGLAGRIVNTARSEPTAATATRRSLTARKPPWRQ